MTWYDFQPPAEQISFGVLTSSEETAPIKGWQDILALPLSRTGKENCDSLLLYQQEQTVNTSRPYTYDLLKLQEIYEKVLSNRLSSAVFTDAVNAIDWCTKPPSFFRQIINMALELEVTLVAYNLAERGHGQYPYDDALERAARVLVPPRIVATNKPPKQGLSAFMTWFEQYASDYRGSWVAVQAGQLIGAASSRDRLIEKLGDFGTEPDVVISRIP